MQYKFRGKRKDNGEWVFGSLTEEYDGTCHINYWASKLIEAENNYWEPVHEMAEVVPETVGMWTGLKDKYGQELYVGDIYQPEGCTHNRYKVLFVSGAFVGGKSDEFCCPLGWADNEESQTKWICKVGNIHEHPHLLTPSQKGDVINTMNNLDPNSQQAEQQEAAGQAPAAETVNEQATAEQVAAVEQEAQEQAMESAEEGGTEG